MIKRIKKLLGLVPTYEKWDEMKSTGLERLLGKEHDIVMHALIPFFVGGGLDLYYYPQNKGFAIATKELIDEYGDGPKNMIYKSYELCMFSPIKFDLDSAKNENSEMGMSHGKLNGMLNMMARYSLMASLNPNETVEFPADFENKDLAGQCMILDAFKDDIGLNIGNKKFGLMLVINIHKEEMNYAMKNGGAKLLQALKDKGVYPYSDLRRDSVI